MSVVLIAVIAAMPGAVAAILLSARRFSGKIKSSEAAVLWQAQEDFRKDLTAHNEMLRSRLDECERVISGLHARIDEYDREKVAISIENGALKAKIKEYDKLVERLGIVKETEATNGH